MNTAHVEILCEQRFLCDMPFSFCKVVCVACQTNYATDKRSGRLCKYQKPCQKETSARRVTNKAPIPHNKLSSTDLSASKEGVLAKTACRHFGSPSWEITRFAS